MEIPKTILIIEDDQDILDIMTYILVHEGHHIISATNGQMLKRLGKIQPALILLDNRLSDGYGSDMCLSLKSDPKTAHFPVILFSANSGLAEMAGACKADAYLAKPFDLNELTELVKRFVN
ncbi:response regulator [Mucilaginibacter antarcticus]|uniref:response regulator n=1 Tax=Mucilaginibacter antarcticus TaxID=1855725 RepID=UPI003632B9E4